MGLGDRSSRRGVLRALGAGITGAIGLSTIGGSESVEAASSDPDRSESAEFSPRDEDRTTTLLSALEESMPSDLAGQDAPPPPGFSWYEQEAYQWSILYRPEWFILRPSPTQNEEGLQFDPVQFWATSLAEHGLTRDLVVDVTPTDFPLEQAYENYVSRLNGIDQYFAGYTPEPLSSQLRTGQPAIQFAAPRANPRGKFAISVTVLSVVGARLYAMSLFGEPDPVAQALNPHITQLEMDQFINVEVPTIVASFGIGG